VQSITTVSNQNPQQIAKQKLINSFLANELDLSGIK
jgi:hypothetical protein